MRKLSDGELVASLDRLAVEHRELVARIVEHLAEMERRGLHLTMGYGSLYVYATERLGLSDHEAYLRIRAARVAKDHEQVIPALENGALSLSTVKALSPHLDRHPELLQLAEHKSKAEVERLVAETTGPSCFQSESTAQMRMRPIAGGRVELTITVREETAKLLEEVLDLSMHENPDRDCDLVLARALRLFAAEKKKPRGGVPAKSARAMPGERRCSFVGADGHRCGETRFVELDHVQPRALGGGDEPANLRWLCRAHNQYEAARRLGPEPVALGRQRGQLERETRVGLVKLGFSRTEAAHAARRAVREASSLELEDIIHAALSALHPGDAKIVSNPPDRPALSG